MVDPNPNNIGCWLAGAPIGGLWGVSRRPEDLKWQLHLARSSRLETICPYMPAYATKYALAKARDGPNSPELSSSDYQIFTHFQPVCDQFAQNRRQRGLRAPWDQGK